MFVVVRSVCKMNIFLLKADKFLNFIFLKCKGCRGLFKNRTCVYIVALEKAVSLKRLNWKNFEAYFRFKYCVNDISSSTFHYLHNMPYVSYFILFCNYIHLKINLFLRNRISFYLGNRRQKPASSVWSWYLLEERCASVRVKSCKVTCNCQSVEQGN